MSHTTPTARQARRVAARRTGLARGLWVAGWCLVVAALVGTPIVTFGEPSFGRNMYAIGLGGALAGLLLVRLGLRWLALAPLLVGYAPFASLWGMASTAILLGSFHPLCGALVVADLGVAALVVRRARRIGWGFLLALPGLVLALHSLVAMAIVIHLFRPMEPEVCASLEEQPGVTWLSRDQTGAGQDVVRVPGGIVAAFKHPGNMIMPWSDSAGDAAIVYFPDVPGLTGGAEADRATAGGGRRVGPELAEGEMPEFLLWDSRGRLLASLLRTAGRHGHLLMPHPLDPQRTSEHRFVPFEGEPNGLLEHDGRYVLWRDKVHVSFLDMDTLEESAPRWTRPAQNRSPIDNLLDLGFDGASRAYFVTIPGDVWEIDLATRASRSIRATFSGGGIDVSPDADRIAVADKMGQSLTVLDRASLEVLAHRYVGFTARPVRIVPELGRLFVGDYMLGGLRAFTIDELEDAGGPVYVGRTVRRLTWDPEHRQLYAASSCGVVRVDPAVAFQTR